MSSAKWRPFVSAWMCSRRASFYRLLYITQDFCNRDLQMSSRHESYVFKLPILPTKSDIQSEKYVSTGRANTGCGCLRIQDPVSIMKIRQY